MSCSQVSSVNYNVNLDIRLEFIQCCLISSDDKRTKQKKELIHHFTVMISTKVRGKAAFQWIENRPVGSFIETFYSSYWYGDIIDTRMASQYKPNMFYDIPLDLSGYKKFT